MANCSGAVVIFLVLCMMVMTTTSADSRRQGKMDHDYFMENFTESKREETKRKIKLILDTLVRVEDITYVNVMVQSSWEILLTSKRLSSRKYF